MGRGKYVEMIPSLLRRELPSFLDEIPELRLPSLELAALVIGRYPVGDFFFCLLSLAPHPAPRERVRRTIFAMLLEEKNAFNVGFGGRLSFMERVRVLKSIKELEVEGIEVVLCSRMEG